MAITTIIVSLFSGVGIAVVMWTLIDSIFKVSSSIKEYRKKRLGYLEKITDKLERIIQLLQK